MKKYIVCLFLVFSFCIFSVNVNSDLARQKAVAEAQRWVDQKIPYVFDGVHDCSGLVLSAYNQAGLKYPRGSSFNGRQTQGMFNGAENKISPGQENLLKPGDAVFFTRGGDAKGGIGHVAIVASINSSNCGGGVEVIETYQEGKNPRRRCLKDMSGYAGAVSFDEVIRANGHTPVDGEGNVLPSIGSPVSGFGSNDNYYDSGFEIDFDKVIQMYVDTFERGVLNISQTLVVIMTFVFLIDFAFRCIKERVTNLEIIVQDLLIGLTKFFLYLLILRNLVGINNFALKTCFSVAGAFDSNLQNYKVLNQIMNSYIQNVEYLLKQFSSESSNFLVNSVKKTMDLFNPFKITVIMGMILYITVIFAYLMFLITRIIMTFVIAVNLNALLIPFWYSTFLHEYIPNPITIFCKAVIQMFLSVIFISISLKILDGVVIEGKEGFDYLAIFTYATYFTLVTFVLKKIMKRVSAIV